MVPALEFFPVTIPPRITTRHPHHPAARINCSSEGIKQRERRGTHQRLEGKESGDCDPIAADSMGSRREREGGREGGRGSLIGSSEPRWK
jgi:hypothetical protein